MTASSPPSLLSPLQRDLLLAFFEREQRFFLTGGSALAGFYLGHRRSDDLDLFSPPGVDLEEAVRALTGGALACGATLTARQTDPDFRRFLARRGSEQCLVDLVIDRAPAVTREKAQFGTIRVDTTREILANKICALIGRSEVKDLVDLQALLAAGEDLDQGFRDAEMKQAGADPATLSWILDQLRIGPAAPLPGGVDSASLETFRRELVTRLRRMAFPQE